MVTRSRALTLGFRLVTAAGTAVLRALSYAGWRYREAAPAGADA
jgi:hypothetical protein